MQFKLQESAQQKSKNKSFGMISDPKHLQKREEFAVFLRKKKRSEILSEKRMNLSFPKFHVEDSSQQMEVKNQLASEIDQTESLGQFDQTHMLNVISALQKKLDAKQVKV